MLTARIVTMPSRIQWPALRRWGRTLGLTGLLLTALAAQEAQAFKLYWIDDNEAHHEITNGGTCPAQPKSRPLLFVHGHPIFGSTAGGPNYQRNWVDGTSFHAALKAPENQGLDIEDYYIEFETHNRSILEDANKIGEAIDLVQTCQDQPNAANVKVAVIGYSKGSISTRVYLRSRFMAGQGQDLSTEYPDDVALTPHSPNINPVSEFIALASPNHGLRLVSTSIAIQQLGNGILGLPCTTYSDSRATAFMSKLNGLTPGGDWSGAHETPASRANGATVADGTLFVSIYDDDDGVGGTLPDGNDCTTPNRKQAFNRGANAENIQIDIGSSNVHQNSVKAFEFICRALYVVRHHRVPPDTTSAVCDPAASGAPIIPDGTGVVLALDHSGSMGIPACATCGSKQNVLRLAAEMFIGTWQAMAGPRDKIGATYFRTGIAQFAASGSGDTLIPLLPDVMPLIADLQAEATNSSGLTAMGGAIQSGIGALQGVAGLLRGVGPNRHVILFTDGLQNVNPKIEDDANQQLLLVNAPNFVDAGIPIDFTGPIAGQNVVVDSIGIGVSPASQALLADLSNETGGVSRFSTDTAALNLFFTMTLVDTLRDSSPQLIAYRYGTLADDEKIESFTVNAGARQFVMRLSWPENESLDFRVEKDGVDLTAAGQWTDGGFYKIFALDLPVALQSGQVDPAGAWRMLIRGRPGVAYEAAAIVDEPQLDYRVSLGPTDLAAGTPLDLTVELSLDGRPIDDAQVTATIRRPTDSIGNILMAFPARHEPPGLVFEPLTSLGQRNAMAALQDEVIWQRLQPASTAVELSRSAPGTYQASYAETAVVGVYEVAFEIGVNDPEVGSLRRAETVTLPVRVSLADAESSSLRIERLAETDRGREAVLQLAPRDRLGNYFGPDHGHLISLTASGKITLGTTQDLGTGRYEIPLILPREGDPEVSLTVAGQSLFAGPVSKLESTEEEHFRAVILIIGILGWALVVFLVFFWWLFRRRGIGPA